MTDADYQWLLDIGRYRPSPEQERWLQVEEDLKLRLPGDYKNLVDKCGAYTWNDFLYVISPFEPPGYGLLYEATKGVDYLRKHRAEFPEEYPLPFYPEPGGLLPWAVSANGNRFYFITMGAPDRWPTLITVARGPDFEVKYHSPTWIIYGLAIGKLRSGVLPVGE